LIEGDKDMKSFGLSPYDAEKNHGDNRPTRFMWKMAVKLPCTCIYVCSAKHSTSKNTLYHNWLSRIADITPSTAYRGWLTFKKDKKEQRNCEWNPNL